MYVSEGSSRVPTLRRINIYISTVGGYGRDGMALLKYESKGVYEYQDMV
jgi:hypothetical protein